MDKRKFLKSSAALAAASMFPRFTTGQQQPAPQENWAGNITYSTDKVLEPRTVDEVRDAVRSATHLRALGTRHSFNTIADSTGSQISLKHFDEISVDDRTRTLTVGAGVKYGQLAPVIDERGYALHNLASLPHISVAGAVSTATHGSGIHNGNLATAVVALEIVTGDGRVLHLSREKDGDAFLAAVVGLGALGVVTRVTLSLLPTYQVAQSVYQNLSFDHLQHHLDEIFSSGYSVSLFTDWQNHCATQVWIKRKLADEDSNQWQPEFFGATLATRKLHPVPGHDAEPCTEQLGAPGPWYERLPHFRMNFTPSSGRELQTEYLVPLDKGYEAILAVERLQRQITPHLFITELRTIAADDLWISTAYHRQSLAIHFTWKPEWPEVRQILPLIEEQLKPFRPRPHWAKLFTLGPDRIQAQYVRLAEFKTSLSGYDPKSKFRNRFISENLYSG
jgi:xylitol oxidase